jgi:hypothetical protein
LPSRYCTTEHKQCRNIDSLNKGGPLQNIKMNISDTAAADRNFQKNAMASFIQIAAVALLVVFCFQIVAPFLSIVVWGMIIAVALYPLHVKLAGSLGGREISYYSGSRYYSCPHTHSRTLRLQPLNLSVPN